MLRFILAGILPRFTNTPIAYYSSIESKVMRPIFRKYLSNGLLSLASIVGCLVVLEIGARFFHLALAPVGEEIGGGLKKILQFDSVLEMRYAENSETKIVSPYGEYDVVYKTNELGIRDRPVPKVKVQGEFRMLAIGNSFTEGWGVPAKAGMLRVAERTANENPSRRRSLRIVNAGMSGFGAAQGYLLARSLIERVMPDAILFVLVGTMINSDANYLSRASFDDAAIATGLSVDAILSGGVGASELSNEFDMTNLLRELGGPSEFARFVAQRLAARKAIMKITPMDPKTDMVAIYRADESSATELYEPTLRHVGALAEMARANAIDFLVVHMPMAFQLSDEEWKEGRKAYKLDQQTMAEETVVKRFCRDLEIDCLFAKDVLGPAVALDSGQTPLFFTHDFHLRQNGNRIVGEWIGHQLERLINSGLTK